MRSGCCACYKVLYARLLVIQINGLKSHCTRITCESLSMHSAFLCDSWYEPAFNPAKLFTIRRCGGGASCTLHFCCMFKNCTNNAPPLIEINGKMHQKCTVVAFLSAFWVTRPCLKGGWLEKRVHSFSLDMMTLSILGQGEHAELHPSPAANAYCRMDVPPCAHFLAPCSSCSWLAWSVHCTQVTNRFLSSS